MLIVDMFEGKVPGPVSSQVGKRIEEMRKDRGWSRKELARRSSISPGSVKLIEESKQFPGIDTLEKVAIAFGGDLPWFFEHWMSSLSTNIQQQSLLLYAKEILSSGGDDAKAFAWLIRKAWSARSEDNPTI